MIPLDVRSFFFDSRHSMFSNDCSAEPAAISAVVVDAILTTAGTLLVSFTHATKPSKCSLRVANMVSPAVLGGNEPHSLATSQLQLSLGGFGPVWRNIVHHWLRSKGITVPNAHTSSTWKVVSRIDVDNTSLINAGALHSMESKTFLGEWPATLCFDHEDSLLRDTLDHNNPGSLEADSHPPDSLGFAQDWVLGSDERRRAIDAMRKAKRTEKESQLVQMPANGNDVSIPSSPVYARTGELSGVNTFYPTPPDGFTSQPPNSSSITVTDHPSETRNEDIAFEKDPTIPSDVRSTELSPEFADSTEQTTGFQDELFDDMGEDGFGPTGVTDADFSFFDEPEADNMGLTFKEHLKLDDSKDDSSGVMGLPHHEHQQQDYESDLAQADQVDTISAVREYSPKVIPQDSPQVEDHECHDSGTAVSTGHPTDEMHDESKASEVTISELSPALVQKRLFQDDCNSEEPIDDRARFLSKDSGTFRPVPFGARVSSFDKKYGNSGRFGYDVKTKTNELPMDDQKNPNISHSSCSLTKAEKCVPDDSMDEGRSSDTDSDSYLNVEGLSRFGDPTLTSNEAEGHDGQRKRKRDGSEASSLHLEKNVSANKYSSAIGESRITTENEACHLIHKMESHFNECVNRHLPNGSLPLSTQQVQDHGSGEPRINLLSEEEIIDVAHILSEEYVFSNSKICPLTGQTSPSRSTDGASMESFMEFALEAVVKKLFPAAQDCDLLGLSSLQEAVPENQSAKLPQRPILQRKQTEGPGLYSNSIFRIPPPHVKVQRSETTLQILPPAIRFWDTLGLAPFSGPKDLITSCIYPSNLRSEKALVQFFDCLSSVYENHKLGLHGIDMSNDESRLSLFPFELDGDAPSSGPIQSVQDACVTAAKSLASRHMDSENITIYLINPSRDPTVFARFCQAAHLIPSNFIKANATSRTGYKRPKVTVKILLMDEIPREDAALDPDPEDLLYLAHEMYERSLPNNVDMMQSGLIIRRSPAAQLASATPKSVQFKMTADPPSDLLEENSFFHLAYSCSPSSQWLTAAWTDNTGQCQTTASYSLQGRNFEEVASELWEATLGILKPKSISWRVIIAKEGLFAPGETESRLTLVYFARK